VFDRPFNELTPADLDRLIRDKVPEGPELDYKRTLPDGSSRDRREFLADVTSFANSRGGFILYGIEEGGGIATDVCGLPGIDPDEEKLRLENLLTTSVDPRIPAVSIASIIASNGHPVILVHSPQSWVRPHAVNFEKHWRFYIRLSTRRVQVGVSELRSLFGMSEDLRKQIREFRIARLSQVATGDTPIALAKGAKLILHVVPVQAFSPGAGIDLNAALTPPPDPVGGGASSGRRNFDGHVRYSLHSEFDKASYVQVFRNGCVESVSCGLLEGTSQYPWPIFYGGNVEEALIESTQEYLDLIRRCSVSPPIVLMVSLLGVKGYRILIAPNHIGNHSAHAIDRDDLILPDLVLEEFPDDLGRDLRPVFDVIWNSGGFFGSPMYDKNNSRKKLPG
jgi:hypothetical protein